MPIVTNSGYLIINVTLGLRPKQVNIYFSGINSTGGNATQTMSSTSQEIPKREANPSSAMVEVFASILAFVFAYTAIAKVSDWEATKLAMYNQVLPDWSKGLLVYSIPLLEIFVALMLLIPQLRRLGFLASVILMLLFTGYVAWVWFGWAGKVPCSCGGIISSLTWGEHLALNLALTGLSAWGFGRMGVGRYGS